MINKEDLFKLFVSIGGPLLVGLIGSFFTAPAISTWYVDLIKPSLNPPNWIFGPVWTLLYVLMGVAMFMVWRKGRDCRDVRIAQTIFIVQLALNLLWSIIFFSTQSPGGALIVIILLWIAILATIIKFARISRLAAWLLVPYILWVSFAMYLNYAIFTLN